MKCGHGRADRDVLALAAGLWVVTLFRGILGYATMTPTCPEREKEALKQMLPINLVLPHVNQRRQSPHGREHSADGGGEAATLYLLHARVSATQQPQISGNLTKS